MYNISANTIFTGKTIVFLPTCHSTNDYALELLANGNPAEGTLIITPNQTNGKGQRGAVWESKPGDNLTFSVIYKPFFLPIQKQFYLNIVCALAVRATLKAILKKEVFVKWPNDVYVNEQKISGILIHNQLIGQNMKHSVLGIGLNVNQSNFADKKAISMSLIGGKPYDLEFVLNCLLEKLEYYFLLLKNGEEVMLKEEYHQVLLGMNEERKFKVEGEVFKGKVLGVEEGGCILIKKDKSIQRYEFKEVEFIFGID